MSVTIKSSTATFPLSNQLTSLTLPSRVGLVSEFILGGSEAASIRNHANAAAPLTVVGTPTYNANSVTVASGGYGNNGFDLGVAPPQSDITMLLIRKKASTGTDINAFSNGSYLGFYGYNGADFYNTQSGTAPSIANLSRPTHSNFYLQIGTGSLAGKGTVSLYTDGVLTSNTGTANGGSSRGTTSLKIGTDISNVNGIGEVAYAALYSRILSAAEIAAAYASLKAYFAFKGVTVS